MRLRRDYTQHEQTLLRQLKVTGALSLGRAMELVGHPARWQGLQRGDNPLILSVRTAFDTCLALTPLGASVLQMPHLSGVNSIAGAAFREEAMAHVEAMGYHILGEGERSIGRDDKKRKQKMLKVTQLRVSDARMEQLLRTGEVDRGASGDLNVPRPGYPQMLVSASARYLTVRHLDYIKEKWHIPTWRSPLLIVVPCDQALQAWIRREEAKHWHTWYANSQHHEQTTGRPYHAYFRHYEVITLPYRAQSTRLSR